ncbi:MAG TPA: dienelactone hydrolase family protein [Acidimicrobiales bacterium]|jgi:carboxymethylenebutenolidase|nr:dienelactone hydrolase family protein [Acidimicrobiales bacterium]
MGEIVQFPSNGSTGRGYLATPEAGAGPGVVVIQEYWGLVPHIEELCDRFAAEGFTALAPDLYHGTTTTEPDEAGKLMMALNLDQAGKDMGGAVDYLLGSDKVRGSQVGVVGFCMGGGLAMVLGTQRGDQIGACVAFYGVIAWPEAQPDWAAMTAPVLGHIAGHDDYFSPATAAELEAKLKDLGKSVEFHVYPDSEHAFFNDTRPEVYDAEASELAWERTLDFLRGHLG